MMSLIFVIQAIACVLLMIVILMQSGRGGGLTETFASAENMFGAKTNEVMIRATVILATIFLVSNLILVRMSSRRERSLFDHTQVTKKKDPNKGLAEQTLPVVTNAVADAK
jgi:preprotein translocase subunit SecG